MGRLRSLVSFQTGLWILQTCIWIQALLPFNWMCGLGKEIVSLEFQFSYFQNGKKQTTTKKICFLALLRGLNKFLYVKCQAYRNYTMNKFPLLLIFHFWKSNKKHGNMVSHINCPGLCSSHDGPAQSPNPTSLYSFFTGALGGGPILTLINQKSQNDVFPVWVNCSLWLWRSW